MSLDNNKIKNLESLASYIASLKESGQRVVLCHGVFDPLHIGHIRHFEQASKMGDVLVVTIAPDQYVNKGPHRPVFTESLRAETIAALDCVDHVAINQWPTAVEAIHLIQPDYYVKGSDYVNADQDLTGGITLERNAIESVGGRIAFTDDITFSSSNLVNKHLNVLPKEVSEYLEYFTGKFSVGQVVRYLDNIKSLRTLVVGEAILDEYEYCGAIGMSSKEPMLAVKHLYSEMYAGGILAVGNHVANFCEYTSLVTLLGQRDTNLEFVMNHLDSRIDTTFLYKKDAPTIVKKRIIDEYSFVKLLEIYDIDDAGLGTTDNRELCRELLLKLETNDVSLIVDFGHGMLSDEAVDVLCQKSKFLAVNTQANAGNRGYHAVSRYPRADFVCMAENEIRLATRNRQDGLDKLVVEVARDLQCGKVIVTRGNKGCFCYSDEEGRFEVPALAGRVVDRVGAGDAFISVVALCIALDTPIEVAAFIGNAVGAQAVATVGNSLPVQRVPLIKHIESLMK